MSRTVPSLPSRFLTGLHAGIVQGGFLPPQHDRIGIGTGWQGRRHHSHHRRATLATHHFQVNRLAAKGDAARSFVRLTRQLRFEMTAFETDISPVLVRAAGA